MYDKQQKKFLNIWIAEDAFKRLKEINDENPEMSKSDIIHEKILKMNPPESYFGVKAMEVVKNMKDNFESQIAIIKCSKKQPKRERIFIEQIEKDAKDIKEKLEAIFPLYKNYQ